MKKADDDQRITKADQLDTEARESRDVDEMDVPGVDFLNVFVEHFPIEYALSGMRINGIVRRPPKTVMKVNEDRAVKETDEQQAQPETTRMFI